MGYGAIASNSETLTMRYPFALSYWLISGIASSVFCCQICIRIISPALVPTVALSIVVSAVGFNLTIHSIQ